MNPGDFDRFLELLLYTTLAGACIPVGAGLAKIERIRPIWLDTVELLAMQASGRVNRRSVR